jgi:hypothetical protein
MRFASWTIARAFMARCVSCALLWRGVPHCAPVGTRTLWRGFGVPCHALCAGSTSAGSSRLGPWRRAWRAYTSSSSVSQCRRDFRVGFSSHAIAATWPSRYCGRAWWFMVPRVTSSPTPLSPIRGEPVHAPCPPLETELVPPKLRLRQARRGTGRRSQETCQRASAQGLADYPSLGTAPGDCGRWGGSQTVPCRRYLTSVGINVRDSG